MRGDAIRFLQKGNVAVSVLTAYENLSTDKNLRHQQLSPSSTRPLQHHRDTTESTAWLVMKLASPEQGNILQ